MSWNLRMGILFNILLNIVIKYYFPNTGNCDYPKLFETDVNNFRKNAYSHPHPPISALKDSCTMSKL